MVRNIDPAHIIITYFGLLVALTMHEAILAFAARWRGDRSSETQSRATLNPLPHIDVFWTVLLPLMILFSGASFLLGGAKPMNFDTRYFKSIRKDINIISIIGMASNLTLALLCVIVIQLANYPVHSFLAGSDPVPRLLYSVAMGNVFIGIFNILPFPGRDCWRLIVNNAPYHVAQKLEANANMISIGLLILLLLGGLHFVFVPFVGVFQYLMAL
jgi:Zn-dependent protease